jgi:shikimate dehydrogenase
MNTRRLILLIGDPVAHSLSPSLHNAAIAHYGLPYHYEACQVASTDLEDAIRGIRALGVTGANVTVPHKERVIPYLDDLTDSARSVGAVNTLFWKDDRLVGDNTDVEGFVWPLSRMNVNPQRVVVLGAGGAARAVVFACRGAERVVVAARRREQARHLLDDIGVDGQSVELMGASEFIADADLIVNATPVGGPGLESELPINLPDTLEGTVVYDLLYAPSPTRFLRDARARGATAIGGKAMLRAQASAAFNRWTGYRFPIRMLDEGLD